MINGNGIMTVVEGGGTSKHVQDDVILSRVRDKLSASPDDPMLHLRLARALIARGMARDREEEIIKHYWHALKATYNIKTHYEVVREFPHRFKEVLIFLHIPKAAGTSLNTVFSRGMLPKESFPIGNGWGASADRITKMTNKERHLIRYVHGHSPYGFHNFFDKECRYVTVLRNPVDRFISEFNFVLSSADHRHHNELNTRGGRISDFIEMQKGASTSNTQTRILGAPFSSFTREEIVLFNESDGIDNLERAKKRLGSEIIFGLQDRYADSLQHISRQLRLPMSKGMQSIHKLKGSGLKRRDLPNSLIAEIERLNALDMQLYQYASQLFDAACAGFRPVS